MEQVKNVCDILETVYNPSTYKIVFVFNQSSCHKKFNEYALQDEQDLVKDGGEQRVRDTTLGGRPQAKVHPDGKA